MIIRVILTTTVFSIWLSGIAGALFIHRFQATQQAVVESRLYFIVNELRTVIQTGLDDLELQLNELSNLQARLQADVARDPLINAIVIFNDHHEILFAAHAADYPASSLARGDTIPQEWQRVTTIGTGGDWQSRSGEFPALGFRLANNFGQNVGGIALQHRYRPGYQLDMDGGPNALVLVPLIALFSVSLLILLLTWGILARSQRQSHSTDLDHQNHASSPA